MIKYRNKVKDEYIETISSLIILLREIAVYWSESWFYIWCRVKNRGMQKLLLVVIKTDCICGLKNGWYNDFIEVLVVVINSINVYLV